MTCGLFSTFFLLIDYVAGLHMSQMMIEGYSCTSVNGVKHPENIFPVFFGVSIAFCGFNSPSGDGFIE